MAVLPAQASRHPQRLRELPPLMLTGDYLSRTMKRRRAMPRKRHTAEEISGKQRGMEMRVA